MGRLFVIFALLLSLACAQDYPAPAPIPVVGEFSYGTWGAPWQYAKCDNELCGEVYLTYDCRSQMVGVMSRPIAPFVLDAIHPGDFFYSLDDASLVRVSSDVVHPTNDTWVAHAPLLQGRYDVFVGLRLIGFPAEVLSGNVGTECRPDLAVEVVGLPPQVQKGLTYALEFRISNVGTPSSVAESVVGRLSVTPGLKIVDISTTGPDYLTSQNEVEFILNIPEILGGTTVVYALTVFAERCNSSAYVVGHVSAECDEPLGNNQDRVVTYFAGADVRIAKTCPDDAFTGEIRTWNILVSNLGNGPATAVVATDSLDIGVEYVNNTGAGVYDPATRTVTWSLGTLVPETYIPLTILGRIISTGGILKNTARVNTTSVECENDSNNINNNESECSIVVTSPDVEVVKTCPNGSVVSGLTYSYLITVSNRGSGAANNVKLVDSLPAGVAFISANASVASHEGRVLTFPPRTLNGGESFSVEVVVSVTATSGVLVNTASAETPSKEGGLGAENNVHSCQNLVVSPDVVVYKTCPDQLVLGTTAEYVISLSNEGNTPAENVVLVDTLPAGVAFESVVETTDYAFAANGQVLTWDIGTLAPSYMIFLTVRVKVVGGVGVLGGSALTNIAFANTTSVEGFAVAENNVYSCNSTYVYPDLAVRKVCPPRGVVAGQLVTYQFLVANLGASAPMDSTLIDTLPAGLTFVSASVLPLSVVGQEVTFDLGPLPASMNLSFSMVAKVEVTSGSLTNSVLLKTTSQEGGFGTTNNANSCSNTVDAPDVAIAKSCPANLVLGELRNYTLTVSNVGGAVADNVVVTDVLAAGLEYVQSWPSAASVSGSSLTWELGSLGSSSVPAVIIIQVRAAGELDAEAELVLSYTNFASVSTSSVEGYAIASNNNASCSNTLIWPDVAINKTCPPELTNNKVVVYMLRVSNLGTSATVGSVVAYDNLPEQVVFVSANPEPTSVAGQQVAWQWPSLAAGEVIEIELRVNVTGFVGEVINSVNVELSRGVEGGKGKVNNFADCVSTITFPDIAVEKVCPDIAVAGRYSEYTLTVRNNGLSPSEGVVVKDYLSTAVRFENMVSGGVQPTVNAGTNVVAWSLGTVAAGQVVVLTFRVYVLPVGDDFVNTIPNRVVVTSTSPERSEDTVNNAADCTTILTYPDVEVYKLCPSGDLVSGNQYTYLVEVSNVGSAIAEDVSLVDDLPAGVTFVSVTPATPAVTVSGQRLSWVVGTLAPDAAPLSLRVTVDVTGTDNSRPLVNYAFVNTSSSEGGRKISNNEYSCSNRLTWPDLLVTKACPENGGSVIVGRQYSYAIVVSNNGTAPASNVTVVDTLPAGVSFVSASPAASTVVGQTVTFELGSVAAGSAGQRSITVTVQITVATGTLANSVEVTTLSLEGGKKATNNAAQCSNVVVAPDLVLEKACPADFSLGSIRNYTLTLRNIGAAGAENVVVRDDLPQGTTLVASSPSPSTVSPLTWAVGNLAPGATVSIVVTVHISGLEAVTSYTNRAFASTSSLEGGAGASNNNASCANTLTYADVSIEKTCPSGALVAGEQATYFLTARNLGSAAATGVAVADTLPAGLTFVSSTPPPTTTLGQLLTWNVGTLAAGASRNFTVVVLVSAAQGELQNTANVITTSTEGGSLKDTNNLAQCSNVVVATDISVEKRCPVELPLGGEGSYVITVRNLGAAPAKNVTVVDTIPAGLAFLVASPASTSHSPNSASWSLGTLAPGAVVTLRLNVTVVGLGDADFTSRVENKVVVQTTSAEVPGGLANNAASCDSAAVWPDVEVRKKCPNGTLVAGNQYVYQLTVTNLGTSVARNVVLVDALPSGVVFSSVTPLSPAAVISGSNITWSVGDLHQFASITFIITANVTGITTSSELVNKAGATTTSKEGGYRLTNNKAECTNVITYVDLAVDKECPVGSLVAGASATYIIHVANLGPSPATGATLVDVLPGGVTFVSASAPSTVVGQVVTFALGNLGGYTNVTITIFVTVQATSGSLFNSARVNSSDVEGGRGINNNHDSCINDVASPDVQVLKVCPSDLPLGANRNYTIIVRNVGTAPANNVVVRDNLPAGLTFVNSWPAATTTTPLTWNLGALSAGATSTVITVEVRAGSAALQANATNFVNQAFVNTTSVEGYSGLTNNQAQCSNILSYPDVAIVKTCPPAGIASGGNADYVIEVTNLGNSPAFGVVVVDTLPAQVTFVNAHPAAASLVGQVVSWNVGTVAPGAKITLHVITTVVARDGVAVNVVRVNATNVEGGLGEANNVAQCTNNVVGADVSITKSCPSSVVVGQQAKYTLTVKNLGQVSASNVHVVDVLPEGLAFVSSNPSGAVYNAATREVSWSLGTVDAGATIPITLNVSVSGPATYPASGAGWTLVNSVRISTTSVEVLAGTSNNVDNCTSVFTWPDLSIKKTCPLGKIALAGIYTYTLEVNNLGNAPALGVVLEEHLPAGVVFVESTVDPASAGPAFPAIAGGVATYPLGTVNPGARIFVYMRVKVTATGGNVTNSAHVKTTSVQGGFFEENDVSSCSNTVVSPNVVLTGLCPIKDLAPGTTATFVLTVSNTGTGDAANVVATANIAALFVVAVVQTIGTSTIVGNQITMTFPLLPAGSVHTVTVTTQPLQATTEQCSAMQYSTFALTSSFSDGNSGNSGAAFTCANRVAYADIAVNKTCPTSLASGSLASYVITVSNVGCGDALSVIVSDALPDGVVYNSSTVVGVANNNATVVVSGQTVTVNLGTVAQATTITIRLYVTVVAYIGTVENVVRVTTTSFEGGRKEANNQASCISTLTYADLEVHKVCPANLVFPNKGVYTITVRNRGTANAENVLVTDTLHPNVTFYNLEPVGTTFTTFNNTRVVVISAGTLVPGQEKVFTLKVQVKIDTVGVVDNNVHVTTSTSEFDTVANNNFDRCENVVVPPEYNN